MGSLDPGSSAYVSYDGEDLWHQRLVLAWLAAGEYVVYTPDHDVFIEQLDAANPDLTGLRLGGAPGTVPYGLAGANIYAFAHPPTGAVLAELIKEGSIHAQTERLARGLVGGVVGAGPMGAGALPPVVVPVPLPVAAAVVPGVAALPPAARLAGRGGTWVLDEPVGSFVIGQEVTVPPGTIDFGGRTFVRIGNDVISVSRVPEGANIDEWARSRLAKFLAQDGRVFDPPSERESFTLAEADRCMKMGKSMLEPLRGPVTMGDSIRSVVQRTSGGFVASHDRWVIEARIEPTHRSRYEHRVISKALDLAYAYDGVNLKRSVAFEYLNRRRQLLEEAHREDPARPNFESSHIYMGEDDESSGVHLSHALRAHVAAELGKEAAIDKERRKAKEAKDARPKAKGAAQEVKEPRPTAKGDKGGKGGGAP
jgi:hypothetical protein